MKLFDRVLLGASVMMALVATVLLLHNRTRSAEPVSPREFTQARGLGLPALRVGDSTARIVPLRGAPHVLYVFATTCGFCEKQRQHIAELLSSLDTSTVISVSQELTSITRGYWASIGAKLPAPEHLRPESAAILDLPGTPALVFISPAGKVVSTYVGTVFSWDIARLRKEVDRARIGT